MMQPKNILPFRALAYNQQKLTQLADVVTPPYDVISPEMQQELYARSPYNFCRVDLTRETGDARYTVAAQVFSQWREEGILVQDRTPALYVHAHDFTLPDGRQVTRKGFFAACLIQDYSQGGIKPHEKTLEGPKVDRFRLMQATQCQLSPVFSLYADPEGRVDALFADGVGVTPAVDFVSHDHERHRLWKIKDPDVASAVSSFMESRPLFIADGHHRYETALNYRNHVLEREQDLSDTAAARHILMYFSCLNDPGLVILPIHRALHGLPNFSLDDFLTRLGEFFEVRPVGEKEMKANLDDLAAAGHDHHAFLLLTRDPQKSYLLRQSRAQWQTSELAKSLPKPLIGLDVTVLHRLVLENILGIDEAAQARQDNIIYWKSTEKAIAETRSGACELTFILNPTRIQDMESVALAGHKMPQKSTYFYPKIISGLVLHDVADAARDG